MAGKKNKTRLWRLAGEPVTPTAFTPAEEQLFLSRFSRLQKKFTLETDSPIGVAPAVARTREQAARLSASFFLKHCQGSRADILESLVDAVSLPVRFHAWFGDEYFVLLGAACWFLDYVERRGLKKQLAAILPAQEDKSAYDMPLMEDLAWPRETLERLTAMLENRTGSRSREFRKLLKLIRKEDAAALRAVFRDALLDYFQRFCEIQSRIKPASKPEAEAPFPLSPLPAAKSLFAAEREKPSVPGLKSFAEDSPGIHFLLRTPELLGVSAEKVQSVMYFRRMTEKLTGFHTPQPYDICAASLLLEFEDDLLAHLNTLTDAVTLCAQRSLPWTLQEADYQKPLSAEQVQDQTPRFLFQPPAEDEKAPLGDEIDQGELLNEAQLFYLATGYLLPRNRVPSPEMTAWFEKQGVPAERAGELALCAMLVSRLDQQLDWEDCLERFGRQREESDWESLELEDPRPVRRGRTPGRRDGGEETDDSLWDIEALDEEDGGSPPDQRSAEPSAPSEQDSGRTAELTRQLKDARKALHDAEQTVRQLRTQLSSEQQAAAQNKAELSSLRDALFRLKQGDAPDESPQEAVIEFPWTGRRRILVFGGHDTWSKVIRPLLPGVRFCDRELLPDLNAIKSADIVWIQPNALSHKFYYRIIETARKESIPVRYFGFASARKCAEQLVEVELAAEGG